MRFKQLFIIGFLFVTTPALAQHSEIGIFGGTSYYLGELNPAIQVTNKVNPSIGVFYRRNWSKRYSLRIGGNYGKLAATDNKTRTEISNFRKISFSSSLWEGYGILEFNFLPYQINGFSSAPFSPYVFIGVAVFYVDPEIENEGRLGTDFNGSVVAPSMPFGFGIKFNLSGNWGMSAEWGMRKTWTDDIDGLPESYYSGYQLSNTQNKDWYSFLGITLNYKILTETDRCPGVIN